MSTAMDREAAAAVSSWWWLSLLGGILFLILGFIVLGYDTRSITTVSILIGVAFVFTGISWLLLGFIVDELKWWLIIGGSVALIAGIIAFTHPYSTLRVLGLLTGWFLLVAGVFDFVSSLMHRERDLWWLGLVVGIVLFGLGAWAVQSSQQSVIVLLTIVGVYCLMRGIRDIIRGVELRRLKKALQAAY